MRIVLALGETLVVSFADTDGEFTISYSDPEGIKVEETDGLPDVTGRGGVLYHEPFDETADKSQGPADAFCLTCNDDPSQCPDICKDTWRT